MCLFYQLFNIGLLNSLTLGAFLGGPEMDIKT